MLYEVITLTDVGFHQFGGMDLISVVDPGVTYSIGGETTARAGVFLGAGADRTAAGGPGSEWSYNFV